MFSKHLFHTVLLCVSEFQAWPPPPGKLPGNVFERVNSPPPGTKKVWNPDPWGRKIVLGPTPGAIIFEKPAKRHKTLARNYENSTELLICVEIL